MFLKKNILFRIPNDPVHMVANMGRETVYHKLQTKETLVTDLCYTFRCVNLPGRDLDKNITSTINIWEHNMLMI